MCDSVGCVEHRRSFRKEQIEGDFDALLTEVIPSRGLLDLACRILRDLWAKRLASSEEQLAALQSRLRGIEIKIDQLLDRIVEAESRSVVTAYERRVRDLEAEKAVTREKMASCGKPLASFAETYRTALDFLANPWKLWRSDRLEDRRAVLRLVFVDQLRYAREEGYRTAKIFSPFKLLGDFKMQRSEMVEPIGIEPTTS